MNTIKKIIPISSLYGFGYLAYKPKKKKNYYYLQKN